MPYIQTDAELALTHKCVEIYHIYENDFVDECTRSYWFSIVSRGSDDDDHGEHGTFDVRELPVITFTEDPNGKREFRPSEDIIKDAIDAGIITPSMETDELDAKLQAAGKRDYDK